MASRTQQNRVYDQRSRLHHNSPSVTRGNTQTLVQSREANPGSKGRYRNISCTHSMILGNIMFDQRVAREDSSILTSILSEEPAKFGVSTQTDNFFERPSTPIYCPRKTGQDVSTQIEHGDLFDFDVEVQTVLEVLVGKTIEQALIEVIEEEEIAVLRERQREFSELRSAEEVEEQRLQEQERRLREERYRRVKEHEEALKKQKENEERVAAAVFTTGFIADLIPNVFKGLEKSGFLSDEVKNDMEGSFMPWLMKEVKRELSSMVGSRQLIMELIREVLENQVNISKGQSEEDAASKDRSEHSSEASSGNINSTDYA